MKYREFWLQYRAPDVDGIFYAANTQRSYFNIHVIDYAAYAEAVKLIEEMAGALESNNLWIKDLPSCDAAYVNNKTVLDKYRAWKEGAK